MDIDGIEYIITTKLMKRRSFVSLNSKFGVHHYSPQYIFLYRFNDVK